MATTPAGDCWKNKRSGGHQNAQAPPSSVSSGIPHHANRPPPLAYERGLLSPEEGVYERL